MVKKRQFLLFLILSLAIIAFIFGNSLQNGEESMSVSGGLMAFLKPVLDPRNKISDHDFHYVLRKCAHFTEFFLLGSSLFGLSDAVSWRKRILLWLFPCVLGLMVAGTDEFIQRFTGRTSAFTDVLIDFGGVLTGTGAAAAIRFLLRLPRKRKKKVN